ncbi:MAG TPA: hypothetical protein VF179_32365 [Thermoanaerobaculia bacterium]|nr:hypothetical protein [Thermoanaerobaculia bacterium]
MFHFISRVVVVSVFALSLNFAMVPAAEARMQVDRKAAVSKTDGSCIEQAMGWLDRILGKKVQKTPKKKVTANDGCGIDPLGHPRPCG